MINQKQECLHWREGKGTPLNEDLYSYCPQNLRCLFFGRPFLPGSRKQPYVFQSFRGSLNILF